MTNVKISAGLLMMHNNKILLVHPTNASWTGTYSIPKGEVEEGEDLLSAAKRETEEELGIIVNSLKFDVYCQPQWIEYKSKTGHVYKKVAYFLVWLHEELNPEKFNLQKEEVDWAGFLTREEAEIKIFPRLLDVLKHIKYDTIK